MGSKQSVDGAPEGEGDPAMAVEGAGSAPAAEAAGGPPKEPATGSSGGGATSQPGAQGPAVPAAAPEPPASAKEESAAAPAATPAEAPAAALAAPEPAASPAESPAAATGAAPEATPAAAPAADGEAEGTGTEPAASSTLVGGEPLLDKKSKQRTLESIMSLKPGDDERTEMSKKISWILRHGAKKVNVPMDEEGWISMGDLASSEILAGTPEERLMSVIEESNSQKPRYELKEVEGRKHVRAISKSRRQAARKERDAGSGEAAPGGRPDRPDRPERRERRRDDREEEGGERGDQWWQQGGGWAPQDDGPSFEQQLAQGYRPVYQGEKVVAMVRGNETVKPGRPELRGKDGKGDRKGKGKGRKGDLDDDNGHGRGKGHNDEGKGEGRGERHGRRDRGDRLDAAALKQVRWRVMQGQEAIVREAWAVESDVVGKFEAGALVAQLSEDKVLRNGIIRMLVEGIEPQAGLKGWVTRSAKAAGGPVFFQPERAPTPGEGEGRKGGKGGRDGGRDRDGGKGGGKDRDRGGKSDGRDKGKGGAQGKGRRPIGDGEGR